MVLKFLGRITFRHVYCHPRHPYYLRAVKTITIKLPDFLNAALDAVAAQKNQPKSAIVRDVLQQSLSSYTTNTRRKATRPSIHNRLKKYQGAGPTGTKDLSSNPRHLAGYGRE
jgi:predicted transcriptional regulator